MKKTKMPSNIKGKTQNDIKEKEQSNKTKKVPNSMYDTSANIICLVLLLGIGIYLAISWSNFPDKIPGHYGFDGTVTRWANKSELFFMPIIGLGVFLMMVMAERIPQIWNTDKTISEKNRELIDQTMKGTLSTIKLVVVVACTFITYNSSLAQNLPVWFTPLFIVLSLCPVGVYYMAVARAK